MAKKSYDKALFRLISVLRMLSFDERPTIASLAEEFNVSRRTIQMDIYFRLEGFNITKDALGRLVFKDSKDIFSGLATLEAKLHSFPTKQKLHHSF